MAILKDTIIQGDLHVTGDLNVIGTTIVNDDIYIKEIDRVDSSSAVSVTNEINMRQVHITLKRIDNKVDFTRTIYLGVPEGMSMNGIEIKYMRLCRSNAASGVGNGNKKWHTIPDNVNIPLRYSINDWGKDLIVFDIIRDSGPDFTENGYDYYELYGQCIVGSIVPGKTAFAKTLYNIYDYPMLDNDSSIPIFLPYGNYRKHYWNDGTEIIEELDKVLPRLLSHGRSGICLYKDNTPISNVAMMRYHKDYSNDIQGWVIKN